MDEEKKKQEEEAKKAAEAATAAAEEAAAAEAAALAEDPIAERDAQIAKLKEERDNYKNVALKRLGKLPGDADFSTPNESGLTVEEIVQKALLDREIATREVERESEVKRLTRENAELRLAAKNRPGAALGGDAGGPTGVKDAVFSDEQIKMLTERAKRLNADPEKFIQKAKENLSKNR